MNDECTDCGWEAAEEDLLCPFCAGCQPEKYAEWKRINEPPPPAPSDSQLKIALTQILPEQLTYDLLYKRLHWIECGQVVWPELKDTELLHVCHLAEKTLSETEWETYEELLCADNEQSFSECVCWIHASWQKRANNLARTKRLEL